MDASGSTLTVQDLLHIQSGTFTSASDLDDVQIDSGAILVLDGDCTVSGNWTNSGNFTHDSHNVIFDGSSAQIVGGSSATGFSSLTVNSGATVNIETTPTVAVRVTVWIKALAIGPVPSSPAGIARRHETPGVASA